MIQQTLADTWQIPTYAQPHLTLSMDGQSVMPAGDNGAFNVEVVREIVTINWGTAPLAQVKWQDTSLNWTGQVCVGGFPTSIHVTQLESIDFPLAVVTMEAYPLKPDVLPYWSAKQRATPYTAPDFLDGIDDDQPEGVTTWIGEVDSPLIGLMQDAMNQAHRVYAFGQLPDENQGWHRVFALPILLESVTTFMR